VEAVGLQRLADGLDPAVHHVRGRHDIGAGVGVDEGLLGQPLKAGVIENAAVLDHAVVPVVGVAVQGHVGDHADLRRRVLDGLDAVGDQAVGVGRARADRILDRAIHIRKQRDSGDAEIARLDGGGGGGFRRQAEDAGHGGDRDAVLGAVMDDQRPDQVGRGQHRLGDQPSHPRTAAQAPGAGVGEGGGGERLGHGAS